jgi:hypothetical protein
MSEKGAKMSTTLEPTRDDPVATEIEGIADCGPSFKEGRDYAVTFTLYLDAKDPEQASDRAMQMRSWFVHRDSGWYSRPDPDFEWHLHDHDGC